MNTATFARYFTIAQLLLLSACGGGGGGKAGVSGGGSSSATSFINWTWIGGSDSFGQPGSYGNQGVTLPANMPQALEGAVSWVDTNNNLWLFGGGGGTGYTDFNDLWKFDGANWTWINGSAVPNQQSIYGAKETSGATYFPGARQYSARWTDSSGNLWLFGGYVRTDISPGSTDASNDLWKYNIASNQWALMNGVVTTNTTNPVTPPQPGIYTNSPGSDYPGARWGTTSWNDPLTPGVFWLFGGYGLDSIGNNGYLNDLWKFDSNLKQWTYVSGSVNNVNQPSNYGQIRIESSTNVPSARQGAVSWTDSSGNLWLFGGFGLDTGNPINMNDLWKFNITSGKWTWMSGSSMFDRSGNYGTPGIPSINNIPGARHFAVSWKDSLGNFWLFGGSGYDWAGNFGALNDLWKFDPISRQWAWMSGSNTRDQIGTYGTLGDPTNVPGNRDVAVSWTNASGLWLFGGQGVDAIGFPGYYNDFWHFQP